MLNLSNNPHNKQKQNRNKFKLNTNKHIKIRGIRKIKDIDQAYKSIHTFQFIKIINYSHNILYYFYKQKQQLLLSIPSDTITLTKMSSTRRKAEQNLYLIPQTQTYRTSHQPLLSSQKTFAIQQKLKLQKQAIQQTRQRQANLDYYIKYNYNPFIEYKGQQGTYINQMVRNRRKDVINIANKLADMKTEEPAIKPHISQKSGHMKNMKDDFQLFSNKILNKIQKQISLGEELDDKSPLKAFKVKDKQSTVNIDQQIIPKQPTQKHLAKYDIQSIAVVKQQNFFLKGYKKTNIFRIARGDDDQLSSQQLLKKYNFCINGVVQKIAKIKVPIYRDISTLSRKVITGQQTGKQNIVDYTDYQLSFKLKQLLFHDIMSVASNRFSPEFLNRKINFQDNFGGNKQMSDTSSEEKDQINIIYRQNQQTKQQNFINQNQQQQEIKDYKLLMSNQAQRKFQKKYNYQREYIEKKLELRKHLTGNTVKDTKLHTDIDDDIKNAFDNFIGLDVSKMDPDRLVRYNKIMKNKTEVNKTKILLETIAYKNKQDQLINMAANKAAKNKK